jgi:hypothetical protein
MTLGVSILLIVMVAAIIAAPLLSDSSATAKDTPGEVQMERFEREKSAALLAIREAALDHAMGKLSDGDHDQLRSFYEHRALTALAGLDSAPPPAGRESRVSPRTVQPPCENCGTISDAKASNCENCSNPLPTAGSF